MASLLAGPGHRDNGATRFNLRANRRKPLPGRVMGNRRPTENTDEDDKDASGPSAKMNIRSSAFAN